MDLNVCVRRGREEEYKDLSFGLVRVLYRQCFWIGHGMRWDGMGI